MKKILIAILVVIVLPVVGVAVAGAMQKPDFQVERSAEMNAPPEVVYASLADFRQWASWSPWEELDPNMKKTHSGAETGKGAVYEWSGNDQVGSGRMTIVDVAPNERIDINLEFLAPFEAKSKNGFVIAPTASGSKVSWSMDGEKGGLIGQIMGLFMPFEESIAADFDKGLGKLKTVTEAEAKRRAEEQKKLEEARAAAEAAAAVEAEAETEE